MANHPHARKRPAGYPPWAKLDHMPWPSMTHRRSDTARSILSRIIKPHQGGKKLPTLINTARPSTWKVIRKEIACCKQWLQAGETRKCTQNVKQHYLGPKKLFFCVNEAAQSKRPDPQELVFNKSGDSLIRNNAFEEKQGFRKRSSVH